MRTYIAFFKDKQITFEAAGLWPAKQYAVQYFKPSKRDAGLVSVVLADVPVNTASI